MNWSEVQQLLESMQKNIDCPICLEIMKNPVLTTCNHNFCNFCISKFLETKRYTPCPLCKVPLTKRSLQENCRLKNIIDTIKKLVSAIEADTGWTYTSSKNCNSPAHRKRRRVNSAGLKRKVSLEDTEQQNEVKTKNTRVAKKRQKSLEDSYKDEDSPSRSTTSVRTTVQACSSSNKFSLEPRLSDTRDTVHSHEALPAPQNNDKGKLKTREHYSLRKDSAIYHKPSCNLRSANNQSTNPDRKLETLVKLAKQISDSRDFQNAGSLSPMIPDVDGRTKLVSQSATVSRCQEVSEFQNGTRYNFRRTPRRSTDKFVPCKNILEAAENRNVKKTTGSPIKNRNQTRCRETPGYKRNANRNKSDPKLLLENQSKKKRILFSKSATKSFRNACISQDTDSGVNIESSLNTNIENLPQMNVSEIVKLTHKQKLPVQSVLKNSECDNCFVAGGQLTETNSDSSSCVTSPEIVTSANLINIPKKTSSCTSLRPEKDPFDVILKVSQETVQPNVTNCEEDNTATLRTVNNLSFKWSAKPDGLKTYSRKLYSRSRENRTKIKRWLCLLPTNFKKVEEDAVIDKNDGLQTLDNNIVGNIDGLCENVSQKEGNNFELGSTPDISVSQQEDESSGCEREEITKCGKTGSSAKSFDGIAPLERSCQKQCEVRKIDDLKIVLEQKNAYVSENGEMESCRIDKPKPKISERNLEKNKIDSTLNVFKSKEADIPGNPNNIALSRINSRKKQQILETDFENSNKDFSLENISVYTTSPDEFQKKFTRSKDADPYKFIESPKLSKPHQSCKKKKSRRRGSSKMPELSFQNRLTRSFQKCSSLKNLKTDPVSLPGGEDGQLVGRDELHAKEPPSGDYNTEKVQPQNGKLCSNSVMEYPPHDGYSKQSSGSVNNTRLGTCVDKDQPASTRDLEASLSSSNNVKLGSDSETKHFTTSRNSKDSLNGINSNAKLGSSFEKEHPTQRYSDGSSRKGNHAKRDSCSEKEPPLTSRHSEDCQMDEYRTTFGRNTDKKPLERSRYHEESLKVGRSNRRISDMQNSFGEQMVSGDSFKSKVSGIREELIENNDDSKLMEPFENQKKSHQRRRSGRLSKMNDRISEEREIMDLVNKISSAEEHDLLFNSQDVSQSFNIVSYSDRGESKTEHFNNRCDTDKKLSLLPDKSNDLIPSGAVCDGEKDCIANDIQKMQRTRTDERKTVITGKTSDTNLISQNSFYGNKEKVTSLSELNRKNNRNKNSNVYGNEIAESVSACELTMERCKKTCPTSLQNTCNEMRDAFVKPSMRMTLRRNKLSMRSFDLQKKDLPISDQSGKIISSKMVMFDDERKESKDAFFKSVNGKDDLSTYNHDPSKKDPQIPTSSSSTSSEIINKFDDTKSGTLSSSDRNLLNRKDEDSEITSVQPPPGGESEVGITKDATASVAYPQELSFCSSRDADGKITNTTEVSLQEPERNKSAQIVLIDNAPYTVIDSVPLELFDEKLTNGLKLDLCFGGSKCLEENTNNTDTMNRLNARESRNVFLTPKHTPIRNKEVLATPTVIPETPFLVLMSPNPDMDSMKSSEQQKSIIQVSDQISVISREKNFDVKDETENEKGMIPRITLPVKGLKNLGTDSHCSNNVISRRDKSGEEEGATKMSVEILKTFKSKVLENDLDCSRQYNDTNLKTGDSENECLVVGSELNTSDVGSNQRNLRKSHSVKRISTKYTSRLQNEDDKEISQPNQKAEAEELNNKITKMSKVMESKLGHESNLRFSKRNISVINDNSESDVGTQIFENDGRSSLHWMDEDLLPVSIATNNQIQDLPLANIATTNQIQDLPLANIATTNQIQNLPLANIATTNQIQDLPLANIATTNQIQNLPLVNIATTNQDLPLAKITTTNQIQDLQLADNITEKSVQKQDAGGNPHSFLHAHQQTMSMKTVEEHLSVPEEEKGTWNSVRHELLASQPGNTDHLKDHYQKKAQEEADAVNENSNTELIRTKEDDEGHSSGTEDLNLNPDPSEFEPPNLAIQPESVMKLLSKNGSTESVKTDSTNSDSSPTKLDKIKETSKFSPILQDKNSRNICSSPKSTPPKTPLVLSQIKNCLRKKTPNKIHELSSPSILTRTQKDQTSSQGSFGHSSLRKYIESQDERLYASLTSPCQILCYSSEDSTKESPKTMMKLSPGSSSAELPISKSCNDDKVQVLPNVQLVDYDISQSSVLSDTDSDSAVSFALPVARRTRSRSQIQNYVQKKNKTPEVKLQKSSQQSKLINSPNNIKQDPKILEESTKIETFPSDKENEKNEVLLRSDSCPTTTTDLDTASILKLSFPTESKTNDCTLEELVLPKSGTVEKEANNFTITESDNFLSSAERNFLISGFCESEQILNKVDLTCEAAAKDERNSVLETQPVSSKQIIEEFTDHLSEIAESSADKTTFQDLNSSAQVPVPSSVSEDNSSGNILEPVLETEPVSSKKIVEEFANHLSGITEPSDFRKVTKSVSQDVNSSSQVSASNVEDFSEDHFSENTLEPTQLSSQSQPKSKSFSGFVLKTESCGTTFKRQLDFALKAENNSSKINVLDTETMNIVHKTQQDPSEKKTDSPKLDIPDPETMSVIPDSLEPFVYDKKESQNSPPPKLLALNENISQSSRSSFVPCSVEQDGSLANVLEEFRVVYKNMSPSEIVDVDGSLGKNDLVRTTDIISANISNSSLRSASLNNQNVGAQIPDGTTVLKPNNVQGKSDIIKEPNPTSNLDIIEEHNPNPNIKDPIRNPNPKIAFSTECHLMIDSQNYIPVKRSKRKCFSLGSNSIEPVLKPRDTNVPVVISEMKSVNQICSKNLDSRLSLSPNATNINQQVRINDTSLSDKLENTERISARIMSGSPLHENVLKDDSVESCVLLPVSQIEEIGQVSTKNKTFSKEQDHNIKSSKDISRSNSGIEELSATAHSVSSSSSSQNNASNRRLSQRIAKKENSNKSLKNSNTKLVSSKSPNSQIESYHKNLEPLPADSCTQQPSCPFSVSEEEEGMVVSDPTDNDTVSTQAPSMDFSEQYKVNNSVGEDCQPVCELEQDRKKVAEQSVEAENIKAKNMENQSQENSALSSASTKCPSGFSENSPIVPNSEKISFEPNKSKNLSNSCEKDVREEDSGSEERLKISPPKKVENRTQSIGNASEFNSTESKIKLISRHIDSSPLKGQSQKDSMDDINFSLPDIPASESEGVYSEPIPDEEMCKESVLQTRPVEFSDKRISEAKLLESNPVEENNKTLDQQTDFQIGSSDTKPTPAANSLAGNKDQILVSDEFSKDSKLQISDCNLLTSSSKRKNSGEQTMVSADNTDAGNFGGRCDENGRVQTDSDEELEDSEEFPRQWIRKPRRQVIKDDSDENEEQVETINLDSAPASSQSALSTQMEKLSTQQCTYLEKDLEEMKKQIAQLEAQLGLDDDVVDIVTDKEENEEVQIEEEPELPVLSGQNLPPGTDCETNKSVVKNKVSDQTYARIISSDDDDDDDLSRQVIPDSDPDDKTVQQNKSTVFHVENIGDVDAHSSGEESADLFCTPGSPSTSVTRSSALHQSKDGGHQEDGEERHLTKSPIKKDPNRNQHYQNKMNKLAKFPRDLSSSEDDGDIVIEDSPKRKIGAKENNRSWTSRISGKMKARLRNSKECKKSGSTKSSPRLERNHSQPTSRAKTTHENKSNSLILKESTLTNTSGVAIAETEQREKDLQLKCFIATGLSNVEVNQVKMLASMAGGKFLLQFSKHVTHVIVKTVSENGRYCDRTLKYFQGIANKCWILSYKWVKESLEKKQLLQMDDYEIIGDTVNGFAHRGPTRSRLSKVPLFKQFEIHIVGNSAELPQDVLKSLIEMSSGVVVSDPEEFSSRPGITCLAIANSTQILKEFRRLKDQIQIYDILLVSREWILDSVAMFRLQSLEGYIQLS